MFRAIAWTVVVIASVVGGPSVALAQEGSQPEWSVELDLGPEQTPAERIAQLNQTIMDMHSRGERGPLLGDRYNDLGVLHARLQEWPQARDAFISAVQAKSYDPDFHRNLALVFMRLEEYEMAASALQEYRSRGGGQAVDIYRLLAQAQLRSGDPEASLATMREGLNALGRTPSAEVCRLALALSQLENEQGESARARDVLEMWQPVALAWRERAQQEGLEEGVPEAEAIESNLVAFYLQDAQLLEQSGLATEAVDLYRKALQLAPGRDDVLPHLISAQLAAGDPMQARVTARLARQDHPQKPGPWLATARIHEADGEVPQAIEAYRKAYELAPQTPGLGLKIGALMLQAGQAAEGRRFLAQIIDAPDTPTEVIYNFAVSLMRDELFAAAVAPLQRVTRESPEFVGGWIALGQTYRARQQFERAVTAYSRALELQPDARTAYNLGVTAGQAKLWDQAVKAYDQTLALDAQHREAMYNRAVALMQAGRLTDADKAFTAFRALEPQHYRAHLNHGVALYRLGRHDDAIGAYNHALEIDNTAEVWDNMGVAYDAKGDKQRAKQCYQEAKKLRGES